MGELIKQAVTDFFGERCPDFDHNCWCCQAWVEIDRIEALEAELHALTCGGTCEVAARNPNVMSYMEHWEGRAEKAEAENQRLRDAAQFAANKLEEINPSNYDHEDVCSLNAASVEVGLYLDAVLRAAQENKA